MQLIGKPQKSIIRGMRGLQHENCCILSGLPVIACDNVALTAYAISCAIWHPVHAERVHLAPP